MENLSMVFPKKNNKKKKHMKHEEIELRSYRKLAWVEFKPTTTEFRSYAVTDWAIRLWIQLALRANFV